jgi:hypothetical protein
MYVHREHEDGRVATLAAILRHYLRLSMNKKGPKVSQQYIKGLEEKLSLETPEMPHTHVVPHVSLPDCLVPELTSKQPSPALHSDDELHSIAVTRLLGSRQAQCVVHCEP